MFTYQVLNELNDELACFPSFKSASKYASKNGGFSIVKYDATLFNWKTIYIREFTNGKWKYTYKTKRK